MSKEKIAAWITELIGELTSIAKPSVKAGQESYMKHVVKYRGVKNPQVRSIAASLIKKHKVSVTVSIQIAKCILKSVTCFQFK